MTFRAPGCLLLAAAAAAAFLVQTAHGQWTHMFVPYDDYGPIVPTPPGAGYSLNDPNRKHLHIYTPPNAQGPFPVLFWGHGNPGNANAGIDSWMVPGVADTGYAIVSWESVTPIKSPDDTLQCQADFELVMDWVEAKGAEYNLSSEEWIVGGRSRGTICSWFGAHSERGAVKGMYLYGALPLELDEMWEVSNILDAVTTSSKPAYFAYGPCCPKPIIVEGPNRCVVYQDDNPSKIDIHNPRNGQRIVNRYQQLGMDEKINLTDCMVRDGTSGNLLHYFPSFVKSLKDDDDDDLNSGGLSVSPSLLVSFGGAMAALLF